MQGTEASLYERLGGIFAITAVVDHFSDNILENAKVGRLSKNPQLRDWSNNQPERLPGLKFMRTLWVQAAAGGPIPYVPTRPGHDTMGLENAHRDFRISPEEFDAVVGELENSLNHFGVPEREKNEVLGAFMAHKDEVTEGWRAAA